MCNGHANDGYAQARSSWMGAKQCLLHKTCGPSNGKTSRHLQWSKVNEGYDFTAFKKDVFELKHAKFHRSPWCLFLTHLSNARLALYGSQVCGPTIIAQYLNDFSSMNCTFSNRKPLVSINV